MRWQGRQGSSNVEDRRGRSTGRTAGRFGIGTIIIVILAILFGADPSEILQLTQGGGSSTTSAPSSTPNDELGQFVSVVLKETEDVWTRIFREEYNQTYRKPTLVLFTETDQSACGFASAASGPFYCPADQQIFIDLSFYDLLRTRFQAPGDFAMAYVIAHEVGHHVQNLLGVTRQVQAQRGRISEAEYNKLSVRLELQADFLAGVWAHYTQSKNLLEEGDVEEALRAAAAIGDDRIQMESRGYVVPETFTHGTSEQRMQWFRLGLQSGDIRQGDTFAPGAVID